MSTHTRSAAMRALAILTRIDLALAIQTKRHNPILDSEIGIEEELINLKEAVDTYRTAGDTLRKYPKMYAYLTRERRAIMQHCLGLVARMHRGWQLPREHTKDDVDEALRRLVRMVVAEFRRTGRAIEPELLAAIRPYVSIRQRLALHDYGVDLVVQASQWNRAVALMGKFPLLRAK